jgi:hypothetical protein
MLHEKEAPIQKHFSDLLPNMVQVFKPLWFITQSLVGLTSAEYCDSLSDIHNGNIGDWRGSTKNILDKKTDDYEIDIFCYLLDVGNDFVREERQRKWMNMDWMFIIISVLI